MIFVLKILFFFSLWLVEIIDWVYFGMFMLADRILRKLMIVIERECGYGSQLALLSWICLLNFCWINLPAYVLLWVLEKWLVSLDGLTASVIKIVIWQGRELSGSIEATAGLSQFKTIPYHRPFFILLENYVLPHFK